MQSYFLAIDIGASSGRHILGHISEGRLCLEEIYRFRNGMDKKDGSLVWDTDRLFKDILEGMKKCREAGKIPVSVGIDTWGVDFVLLDKNNQMVGPAVGYRDSRTRGIEKEVASLISSEELYRRTGIQKASYNTIYQLAALKKFHPEYLESADTLLMMPDYFHFLLSGKKTQEYTEATTSQLIDPETRKWDRDLIRMMGLPSALFLDPSMPGYCPGTLSEKVQKEVGFNCEVILPPSHDTASAVMAVPSEEEDVCYISSGTWSLMGVVREKADCSEMSREKNFTNEGGYGGKITYLTNIMGLWMIQSVRNALAPDMSYGTLCDLASKESIRSIVDCQDDSFLAPDDMPSAIREFCRKTDQQVPESLPELAAVTYRSLAECYAGKLTEIQSLTGHLYDKIHIIGGGSGADWLNRLTAECTGLPVLAGPSEATATGNILCQMIQKGLFRDLKKARKCVMNSFDIKKYQ